MLFTRLAISIKWLLAAFGLLVALVLVAIICLRYPEHDYSLVVPLLSESETQLARALEGHVRRLAVDIGARNVTRHPQALAEAADYVESEWRSQGFAVTRQAIGGNPAEGENLFVDVPGKNPALAEFVIGAHYDTAGDSPGADDNGTGVAALLELSRRLSAEPIDRAVRFVAFTNEEPPEYRTEKMGSVAYVKEFARRPVALMLSLETIGYYTKDPDSQLYPWPMGVFYPDVGDFIGFVGNVASRPAARQVLEAFRRASNFPAGAVTLPDLVEGMGWSDHWAFWESDVPALMVTDTAFFRYGYYHTRDDTVDKIRFADLARVVNALELVLRDPAVTGR